MVQESSNKNTPPLKNSIKPSLPYTPCSTKKIFFSHQTKLNFFRLKRKTRKIWPFKMPTMIVFNNQLEDPFEQIHRHPRGSLKSPFSDCPCLPPWGHHHISCRNAVSWVINMADCPEYQSMRWSWNYLLTGDGRCSQIHHNDSPNSVG